MYLLWTQYVPCISCVFCIYEYFCCILVHFHLLLSSLSTTLMSSSSLIKTLAQVWDQLRNTSKIFHMLILTCHIYFILEDKWNYTPVETCALHSFGCLLKTSFYPLTYCFVPTKTFTICMDMCDWSQGHSHLSSGAFVFTGSQPLLEEVHHLLNMATEQELCCL